MTDVDGILVGHFTCSERPTGCTVITCSSSFTAGVDVRGGAPGTRETDVLRAESTVQQIHAVVLSGGSAFGLDAASGAVRYIEEQGRGFAIGEIRVPVVCSAILYDLNVGSSHLRPDADAGYQAAKAADGSPVTEGNVGAGAGATVGKLLGFEHAMKGGLGSWSVSRPDGFQIGALVAVNCVGDVIDPVTGRILAGARKEDGMGFADVMLRIRCGSPVNPPPRASTVIGVVACNADLTKAQCNRVAQMAQDALARCIFPAHTPWDGDTVFALATGSWTADHGAADIGIIGALAAEVLASAILRGIRQAQGWGDYPAERDFPGAR